MLYRVTYGAETLHDPRTDARAEKCVLSEEIGRSSTLSLRLMPGSLSRPVQAMDARREIVLWQDRLPIFMGRATSVDTALDGTVTIEAEDSRAYLNDTHVPPYATYHASGWDGEPNVPADAGGIFRWLVERHNATCGTGLRAFVVGECAGDGRKAFRSSTQWPKTLSEMQEKLAGSLGGDIQTSYTPDGTKMLSWLSAGRGRAVQEVRFGENLLDFARRSEATDIVTAIVPYIKRQGAEEAAPLTPQDRSSCSLPDGFEWRGSMVVHTEAAEAHGIIWEKRDYDAENARVAAENAASDISAAILGIESIDISALDLSAIDPSVQPIRVLDWVDVHARPLGFHARVMCVKRTLDCLDPSSTSYTLGATRKTLTNGLVSSQTRMETIAEESIQAAAALTQSQKDTAQELREGIAGAVAETHEEYCMTSSRADEPGQGASWSRTPPDPGQGCVWRRTVTTTGDGSTMVSDPVPLTGDDGAVIELLASNGTTFRRKGESTVISATVVIGSWRISDLDSLRQAFGDAAAAGWEERTASGTWKAIPSTDQRVGSGGFSLTVREADIEKAATYRFSVSS